MRISDWSSDVCSSDLHLTRPAAQRHLVDDGVLAGDLDRHRIDIGRNGAAAECAPGGKGEHHRAGAKVKDVAEDRKSVVSGKSVSVRVDLGGHRIIKKKKYIKESRQNIKK